MRKTRDQIPYIVLLLTVLLCCLFLPILLRAQTNTFAAINLPNTFTGFQSFNIGVFSQSLMTSLKTVSTNYTLTTADTWVNVTGTTTITAPHIRVGQRWVVFNSGIATVTLQADSGTMNGAPTVSITPELGFEVTCDGTNCFASGGGGGGGGGGGTVTSIGLQINGASSSGIFTVTNSPIILSGNLNYNLLGSSGGVTYFSSSSTLSSSGTLSSGNPIVGGGAGLAPTSGSRSGNTTEFATFTGSATAARCIDTDANGNLQVTPADCGTGGSGVTIQTNTTNNASQILLNFQNVGVFSWANPSGGIEQVNFSSQSANTFIAAPNGAPGIPAARLIVAADIPAGTLCATNFFATGLNAGMAPNCVQPSFSNLTGIISLAQTPLTTNGDILSVSGGALARVAAAGGQDFFLQGANAAPPTWGVLPNCGDGTHVCAYSTTTHLWSNVVITAGSGTINNASQFSTAYYSAAGTTNTISGIAAPTSPNVPYIYTDTPSGGAATAPAWTLPGVPVNAQTGVSYTLVALDRENQVTMNNAGAISVTLPQANSGGFTNNFNFSLGDIGAGTVTITPVTSTINGTTSQIVPQHWISYVYSDNTNYRSWTLPDIAAFPNCPTGAEGFTAATGVFSCNTFGQGTVTSVGLTQTGAIFTITNTPITTAGNINIAFANENANTVFAGPTTGGATTPTFRALVAADIPNPAGDVTGTYAATTVTGLHFGATGIPTGTAPSSGQCLEYNGTNITGAACSGGGGTGQVNYPINYPVRTDPIGLSLTTPITVANSVSATSIIGSTFAGRNYIPAGAMLPNGPGAKTLRIYAVGTYSTAVSVPTLTLVVLLSGNAISTFTVPIIGSASSNGFEFQYDITITGLTTALMSGCVHTVGAANAELAACVTTSANSLSFTSQQSIDVQVQWNTMSASDTITVSTLDIGTVNAL